jgi:hypothetical protein
MVYSLPIAVILLGIILVAPTLDEQRYVDADWQREFVNVDVSRDLSDDLSRKFYEAQTKNLTPAAVRSDHGVAVISLGLSIAVLFLVLRLRTFRDLLNIETLADRRAMYLMATGTWWAWAPAQALWLKYTFDRGDYPWWADNIAIPVGGTVFFCLLGFPFVLCGAYLAMRNIALPVRILKRMDLCRGVVASLLSAIPLCWFVFAGMRAYWEGDVFTMPVSVSGVYATLCMWAAACTQRIA